MKKEGYYFMNNYITTSTNDYFKKFINSENNKYDTTEFLVAMIVLDELNVPRVDNINGETYCYSIVDRIKWLYNNKNNNIISPQYILDKSITFEEYCQKYVKVWNKVESEYIPFKFLHNQHKTYTHIENNKFSIINQYRQEGMTTLLSNYSVYKALSNPNITIGYFGVSKDHLRDVFKNIVPFELQCSIKRQTIDSIEFYNGSKIIFKFLTENNLVGVGVNIMLLDNYAFFNNITIENIYRHLKINGQLIISSTPIKDSDFNKLCVDAFENINDFKYLKLNWFDDERFNQHIKVDINGVKYNDWSRNILNHSGKERFEEEVLGLVL